MTGGVIDSFFVALGFRPDSSGLKSFQRQADAAKESVLSVGNALTAFVTGMAIKGIADIGNEFEQNKIAIAGFLSALGVSSDFNAGLEDADATLQSITKSAALLPGEAEEYIEVFRAGLVGIRGAIPNGTLDEMTAFSNRFTAVGKTLKVDAPQIGRDLSLLLGVKGRAGMTTLTFMRMLPFMMKVEGQANLTAEAFNKMSQPERLALLQESFKGLQPMLDASASSFDAMWGAAKSALKQIVRLGTKGLFTGMKKGLEQINALFFDANGQVTEFGKGVIDTFGKIGRTVTNVVTFGAAIVTWFAKSKHAATILKTALSVLGLALAALAFNKVTGGVGRLILGLFNLKRLLMGGLFLAIALIAEDLYVFYRGGESITGLIVKKWAPAIHLIKAALAGLIAILLRAQIVALVTASRMAVMWLVSLGPIGLLIAAAAALAAGIYYVVTRWQTFGAVTKTVVAVVATALGVLGAAYLAVKAIAIATAVKAGIAWLVALGPIGLIIAALILVGVTIYQLWTRWDEVVGFMKKHWIAFTLILATNPLLALMVAAVALAKNWDSIIDSMKDAWNSFAETINAIGVITLPTFKAEAPMLPEGEGVRLPEAGPAPFAYQQPYTATMGGAGSEPFEQPGDRRRPLAAIPEPAAERNRRVAASAYRATRAPAPMGAQPMTPWMPEMVTTPETYRAPAYVAPAAAMDGTRAGAGAASSNTSSVTTTYVTVPSISVTGGPNPEATAKAVRREMERAYRSTIRDAQSKGPAL